MPPSVDTLTPLEKALVETLQAMHHDVIKELRIFRWQTVMLVVFLIGVVSLLKGVDPRIAAAPLHEFAPADNGLSAPAMILPQPSEGAAPDLRPEP